MKAITKIFHIITFWFILLINSISALQLKLCSVENPSIHFQIVNVFGRIAEHKVLGYTSSYNSYSPSPLSLWLPNKWSRRLRVDEPDWKKLFEGNGNKINRNIFESKIANLSFKYPMECPMPQEVLKILTIPSISESQLREDFNLRESVEKVFMENYSSNQKLLDIIYFLFGGRNELDIIEMEKFVLEWGRYACKDDPVIDFPIFESRIMEKYNLSNS